MTSRTDWLLYGANGYTGELIAEEAAGRGLRPILAGRRRGPVEALARRLNLEHRVFDLDDAATLQQTLRGVGAVLLAAGPFGVTSAPVRKACIATGCHYLDITGEMGVFEATQLDGPAAAQGGSVLMPGVGFDVVPTDCLAAALRAALPDATHLTLGLHGLSGISRGTLKTMLVEMSRGAGNVVREGGKLRPEPAFARTRTLPFGDKPRHGVGFPWGDLVTAYISTSIPNIEIYFSMPEGQVRMARLMSRALPALRLPSVMKLAQRAIDTWVTGPGPQLRQVGRCLIWGEVRNAAGKTVQGHAQTPEGYAFTAVAAVTSITRLLSHPPRPGMHTPSQAFGHEFLATLPGCKLSVEVEPLRKAAAAPRR